MVRRSIRVLVVMLVLLAAAVPAVARTKGSNSGSATAAWLTDGNMNSCDGEKPVYPDGSSISSDNRITGDLYVWILSNEAVDENAITWSAVTGNSAQVYIGDLDPTGDYCGLYQEMYVDWHSGGGGDGDNEPDTDDGGPLSGELFGSWSFKFDYAGKNYSADSARF